MDAPGFAWKRITPDDGKHYFFGYYDRCPWDPSGRYHLFLRVDQCERLPRVGERADIGVYDRQTGQCEILTSTRAWCHQQGSMTLWLKRRPGCFVFNDFDEDAGGMHAKIYSLPERRVVGRYDRAIYCITNDGRRAACLDFARIPRRGYSYADAAVPFDRRHPDLDAEGLFVMDLDDGSGKLLVSYRQMMDLHPTPYELPDVYLWLNHVIWNVDGSRVLWLFRQCPDPRDPKWKTYMFTVGIDGSGLRLPLPDFYWHDMISHQIWGRTPTEILVDANWRGAGSDYVVFDESRLPLRAERISAGLGPMGHLVFSPDHRLMAADTYPQPDKRQSLGLVDVATGAVKTVGRFRHDQPPGTIVEVRCDLHPRWSEDSRLLTVDSIDGGRRAIYLLELPDGVF